MNKKSRAAENAELNKVFEAEAEYVLKLGREMTHEEIRKFIHGYYSVLRPMPERVPTESELAAEEAGKVAARKRLSEQAQTPQEAK